MKMEKKQAGKTLKMERRQTGRTLKIYLYNAKAKLILCFNKEMLDRALKESTETVIEIFEGVGPFKTKNSDIPMEIDFSNIEFRNEVHINEDDEIYIGQFVVGTNIKEGRGIMLTADKDLYEGYWVNNQKWGKGRIIFNNGDIYQGDWVDSKSQGHGVFISEEGKYKGEWFCDQREGFGTFLWPDGRKYTGEWYNDKQHGKVAYIDSNGNKVIGEYIEGELILHGQSAFSSNGASSVDDNPFTISPSAGHARRSGEPETGSILNPLNEKKNE